MALGVTCKNGHSYIQADVYENHPEGAPYCPVCFVDWGAKNNFDLQPWHFENATEILKETKRTKLFAAIRQVQEQIMEKHRKTHQYQSGNFCADCGQRLTNPISQNSVLYELEKVRKEKSND